MVAPAWQERFELARPAYRDKIKRYSNRYYRMIPGYEAQDLESDLVEVLWLACVSYDPNYGSKFNTFFWELVKRRFLDMRKRATRKKRAGDLTSISLDIDAVRAVVEQVTLGSSAEEEMLARIVVTERFRSGKKAR